MTFPYTISRNLANRTVAPTVKSCDANVKITMYEGWKFEELKEVARKKLKSF